VPKLTLRRRKSPLERAAEHGFALFHCSLPCYPKFCVVHLTRDLRASMHGSRGQRLALSAGLGCFAARPGDHTVAPLERVACLNASSPANDNHSLSNALDARTESEMESTLSDLVASQPSAVVRWESSKSRPGRVHHLP